jgi:hypothetical protein
MNDAVAERLGFEWVLPRLSANVAQLVEQRFRKARVVSSILTVGSILKPSQNTVKSGMI